MTGAAVEVADEDDELALVGGGGGVEEGAVGDGFVLSVVDWDVVGCGEGCSVGAVVGDCPGDVVVGVEACEPVVGGHDFESVVFGPSCWVV